MLFTQRCASLNIEKIGNISMSIWLITYLISINKTDIYQAHAPLEYEAPKQVKTDVFLEESKIMMGVWPILNSSEKLIHESSPFQVNDSYFLALESSKTSNLLHSQWLVWHPDLPCNIQNLRLNLFLPSFLFLNAISNSLAIFQLNHTYYFQKLGFSPSQGDYSLDA